MEPEAPDCLGQAMENSTEAQGGGSLGCLLMIQMVKNLATMQETWVGSLVWEDTLEEEMAGHSNILAWGIPWAVEPGGLQFMGRKELDMTK